MLYILRMLMSMLFFSPPEKHATACFNGAFPDHRHFLLVNFGRFHDGVRAVIRELGHRIVLEIEDAYIGRLIHVFGLGGYEKSSEFPMRLIRIIGLQDH